MTISPYDNLPSGNNDIPEPAEYVDVEIPIAPPTQPRTVSHTPKEKHRPSKTVPFTPTPQYSNVSIKNFLGCFEYKLPFEETLLVPDTMPDMQKVLFAEGSVNTSHPTKVCYDVNDFLTGNITAYTVYRPASSAHSPAAGPAAYNDCPIDVVKSVIPFKTDKCWSEAPGESFRPDVSILSINAEMINERKFTIKGEVLIKISCIASRDLKLFKGAADNDLITLNNSVKATALDHETSDTTEILQEITIKEDQPSPIKILKFSLNVSENHRQITSGKLVVNASIHVNALYLGETSDGEKRLCSLENKTDFTQFIVMDDNTDPALVRISFNSGDLELAIENKDKFKLSGSITTLISSYCSRSIDIVSDAYHKTKELCFDTISDHMCCIKDTVSGEISAREIVTLSDSDKKPSALLCGSCKTPSPEGRIEKDRIIIEGTVPIKILALDEDGLPFIIDHAVPIRGALAHNSNMSDPNRLDARIDTTIKEFWFGEINSRQLELNISLNLNVWLSAEESFDTIDSLCFAENEASAAKGRMAIYVVGNGDTLWDVAKRYKTDMDSLAALNDLDPTTPLPVGAKLFIAK